MGNSKYYVVWSGFAPGVYDSWEEARLQVEGYSDASYRAYKTQAEAVEAFREGYDKAGLLQEVARKVQEMAATGTEIKPHPASAGATRSGSTTSVTGGAARPTGPVGQFIAVDAACSGNPGPMEYQGVAFPSRTRLFHVGPLQGGTNNIGEFLAIVHALALQASQGTRLPIYSDSHNAMLWVRGGRCKTKLEENDVNAPIFDLIDRAEQWLASHDITVPILKWDTKAWGEIPADFGRK